MAPMLEKYVSSDDESSISEPNEEYSNEEETFENNDVNENSDEKNSNKRKQSLKEKLQKEKEEFGYFEATVPSDEFHLWHLGEKKVNLQEIYHTKYLYDDKSGINFGEGRENSCILICPIPKGFYEQEIYDFFSQVAPIRRMRIKRDPKNGSIIKNFSYAYVDFKDPESATLVCEEIPMLYIRGEMVTIKMCKARPERIEKFFNELTPEQYAALILRDSAVKGESYSLRRRKIIPSLVFAKNRSLPLYLKYMREKKQEERDQKLKNTLSKYGLSYSYEEIAMESIEEQTSAANGDKKRKRDQTPSKRKQSKSA